MAPTTQTKLPLLSVADILSAPDIHEDVVEVPQWNGAVRIRSFSKAQQQEMREQATVRGELDSAQLELLMFVHGVVEPQFTPDQVEQLRQKAAGAIDLVLKQILRISGLSEEAQKAADKSAPAR